MQFLTTVAGETLEGLAARAYELAPGAPKALAKRAQAAVVDANPFLRAADAVPEGTVVAIPDLDGTSAGAATQDADRTALEVVVSQFTGTAPAALDAILGDAGEAATDTARSLELLRSAELKRLARDNEQLQAALPAMTKLAAARGDAGRSYESLAREALVGTRSELDGLRDAFA